MSLKILVLSWFQFIFRLILQIGNFSQYLRKFYLTTSFSQSHQLAINNSYSSSFITFTLNLPEFMISISLLLGSSKLNYSTPKYQMYYFAFLFCFLFTGVPSSGEVYF